MSLLTIGTVAFDSIETPFGKVEKVIGGAAMYSSLAASYFYDDIHLVSVIGEDFPQETLDDLNRRGVDLSGLQRIAGKKSFFWSGKYFRDMNHRDTLVTELNVLAEFDPVLPDEYRDPRYVMLANLTPEVQLKVLDQLRQRPRLIVADTMNYWIETALDDLQEMLRRIDVLAINDEEAFQLSGEHTLVKAARSILEMGPDYLVIKKGEHGSLLFFDDHIFFAPALPLAEVYDPTGAGDTFAGGFIGYLAKTDDLSFENMKRAVIYGSAMASFVVEEFGIKKLEHLGEEQIGNRLYEFVLLTNFDLDFSK